MAFATAYALGAGTRARRARIAMLEERAHRLEEERQAAAERERTRVARDVHDIVAHAVTVMVVQAEAGPVVVRRDPERAEEVFAVIADSGREAISQLRRALAALRSPDGVAVRNPPPDGLAAPSTGSAGAMPSIREGATERSPVPGLARLPELLAVARNTGLAITVVPAGEPRRLDADVDVAAYRVVQEALTNTIRHAAARTVRIAIEWSAHQVRIQLTDDGCGVSGDRDPDGDHKPGGGRDAGGYGTGDVGAVGPGGLGGPEDSARHEARPGGYRIVAYGGASRGVRGPMRGGHDPHRRRTRRGPTVHRRAA